MLLSILILLALALVAPWLLRLTRSATGWILALAPAGIFAWLFKQFLGGNSEQPFRESWNWVPAMQLKLSFQLDGLALLFGFLIAGIGAFILVYAGAYLKDHPRLGRFYSFLLLFMASMLGVVWSDHAISLFVFWELTSLSSYLLIGFNNDKAASRDGALQALLVTGLGGLALLAGLILLAMVSGTWEFHGMIAQAQSISVSGLYPAMTILIFLGAFTKSAQFPFHFWLPNAMEAPTPVSAYLHSATMVKAGVYLLARLTPILGGTLIWENTLLVVGAITMIGGGYLALFQKDLKKLLAYSTVSALGIMVLLIGVGTPFAFGAAMTFILAHACYKGALFMVAGAVDHSTGTRDIDQLSGLAPKMPVTATAAMLAAFSMAGIPPLFGFVAKEAFYETLQKISLFPWAFVSLGVLASLCFVLVALWVAITPFWGKRKSTPHEPHEGSLGLFLGPLVLALLGGLWGIWPKFLAQDWVQGAASALAAKELSYPLKLWHGLNQTLMLSAATLVLGLLLFLLHRFWRPILNLLKPLNTYGPEAWYQGALVLLKRLAAFQTRVWQSGYLRIYIIFVILTALGLGGVTLLSGFDFEFPTLRKDAYPYEYLLTSVILLAALFATLTRSKLGAMAGLGVVGFGVALVFVLYGAPDLAMTQILVETLVVILLVLGFHHMPGFQFMGKRKAVLRDLLIAGSIGAFMTLLVLAATQVHFTESVSDFYARESLPLAHGRNVVNVILVDFRALDTLGEIVVLALAGFGVYAMLKLKPKSEKSP